MGEAMNLPIKIRPFDPHAASPELWASFHASRRAIAADLWPDNPVLSDEETEIELKRVDPLNDVRRWIALAGGDVIGSARAFFRRHGTPNADEHAPYLYCWGAVQPGSRLRGAGSLLLREVHGLMTSLGKTMLTTSAHTEPGHAFLTHAGAVAKLKTVASRAMFSQLDWDQLRLWEDAASGLGLVWECFAGRVPRERLAAFCPAFTDLFTGVPLGELDVAPVRFEIEGYDQWYQTLDRVGGAHHLVVLRAPDGAVAGISEAGWDSRTPGFVEQQLTAVARSWRARGVAKALKARLIRQVHDSHPEAELMRTGNADSNKPMLSINARVGFKVHRCFVDYQITRAALDAWLAATPLPGFRG